MISKEWTFSWGLKITYFPFFSFFWVHLGTMVSNRTKKAVSLFIAFFQGGHRRAIYKTPITRPCILLALTSSAISLHLNCKHYCTFHPIPLTITHFMKAVLSPFLKNLLIKMILLFFAYYNSIFWIKGGKKTIFDECEVWVKIVVHSKFI